MERALRQRYAALRQSSQSQGTNAGQSQNQSSEGTDKVDWQLGKSITESISAAQVGEKWSDISFRCSDQDEKDEAIKAHKFILASRSPVFEAMFFGAMKETNDEIKLDDITAETFQLFLR